MSLSTQAHCINREEGKAIWFLGTLMIVKATRETTGGTFSLIEQLAPPQFATPVHVHHGEDEPFYVLEGEVVFQCGDQTIRATAGSYVFAPKDVPHSYRIEGHRPARLLIMTMPAGLEEFFEELSEPASGPVLPPGPPDMNELMPRLMEAAARYHLEILGPPPAV